MITISSLLFAINFIRQFLLLLLDGTIHITCSFTILLSIVEDFHLFQFFLAKATKVHFLMFQTAKNVNYLKWGLVIAIIELFFLLKVFKL